MREILNKYSRSKFIHNTKTPRFLVVSLASILLIAPFTSVASEQLTSPNYILDPNVANSFGGFSETGSYRLLDSGGEAAIGLGESGSYKLSSGYIAQLEQSIELNVLPEGLHAYFPLNTGLGIQAYDSSANSNNGVLEGNPTWVSDGKIGKSLEFDGVNDWVNFTGLPIGDNNAVASGTYSAWIKTTNDTGEMVIVGDFNTSNNANRRFIGVEDGYAMMHHRRSTSGEKTVSDVFVADGEWHHIAAYMSTDLRVLYVNGQEIERTTTSLNNVPTNPNHAAIGRRNVSIPQSYFDGIIDEVKVYEKQLSEDEILDEYIANQQGIPNALTLPRIGASQSQTVGAEAVVLTDAPGYELAISQDGNLSTANDDEIPPISGSIMFPEAWIEGTTTGFGFTITDAIDRDGKWGTAPDFEYAAIPNTVSTFYSRSGLSGGAKEVTTLQFRLGVDGAQAAGVYTNRLGFTATLKP